MKKEIKKVKKDKCAFCGKDSKRMINERNFSAFVCNKCNNLANAFALEKVHQLLADMRAK